MLPKTCMQQRAGNNSLCPHISEVGRNHWRSSGPTLLLKAGSDRSGACPAEFLETWHDENWTTFPSDHLCILFPSSLVCAVFSGFSLGLFWMWNRNTIWRRGSQRHENKPQGRSTNLVRAKCHSSTVPRNRDICFPLQTSTCSILPAATSGLQRHTVLTKHCHQMSLSSIS